MRILLIPLLIILAAQVQSKDLNLLGSEEVITRGTIIKSSALNQLTTYHVIYKKSFYICGVSRHHQSSRAIVSCTDNKK